MSFFLRRILAFAIALLWHSAASEQEFPSYNYGIDRSKLFKRQYPGPYVTAGIKTGSGPNGSKPLRLEVRELEKDPMTWTLYLLGMDMMQYTDQSELLSWYQVTGLQPASSLFSVAD